MNRLAILLLLTVISAITIIPPQQTLPAYASTSSTETLIDNGGFEDGWHLETTYWTPEGGPFHNQYQEITPPENWTAWWREGFTCSGTPDWVTGRPEVRVISAIPDPKRIHSGEQAVQWFTLWRCHEGGLYQRVAAEVGYYYDFSIFAHSWFSNCSTRPHDPPYDYDCVTPIAWAQDWLSVGIDPTGGIDPLGPAVVWGQAQEVYGVYDEILTTGRVQAQGDTLTVFVKSETSHPLKHADFYIDDAIMRDMTYRVYLPIAGGTDD